MDGKPPCMLILQLGRCSRTGALLPEPAQRTVGHLCVLADVLPRPSAAPAFLEDPYRTATGTAGALSLHDPRMEQKREKSEVAMGLEA